MGEAINPWLHILAATVWVGPQIFLFVAAVPAVRSVEDAQQRARALRILTQRFGYLAMLALAVLVITGIGNLYEQDLDTDELFDLRWGVVFQVKMTLVIIAVALTALHAMFLGPRLMRMQEASADEAQIARLRGISMAVSAIALLISIGIIFCAALMDSSWATNG
jgi:uncharacterized membrane protein